MGKVEKLLNKVLLGSSDKNFRFNDLCRLLKKLGFNERIKGDHHIFFLEHVKEIINIQPKGNLAKAYQVKQVRNIILHYKLGDVFNE